MWEGREVVVMMEEEEEEEEEKKKTKRIVRMTKAKETGKE